MAIVRIKGVPVEMSGQTYVIPPLSLGALEQLQERLAAVNGDISDAAQVATVVDAAHAALRRNYPELTREAVAELVDVGNMVEVFEALMDVSGMRRKAGEAKSREGDTPGEA